MRVSTLSGLPPASTSSAGALSSMLTANEIFCPAPIVGSLGPMTFWTAMSMTAGLRYTASIKSSSSTAPETSAAANGGVFLHTGSWLMPLARMISTASRTVCDGFTYSSAGVAPRVSSTAPTHSSHSRMNPKLAIQSSLKTFDR